MLYITRAIESHDYLGGVMASLPPKETLLRAQEFLQCAEYAARNNYFNASVLCAYAALFWATRAALGYEGLDQPRWAHHDLQSKFIQELVEKRRRYPKKFGRWFVNAYDLRNAAQYHPVPPKVKNVRRTLYHAIEFIQTIAEVISI
jgi:uncharacterized protein (UPF0332 family)